MNPDLILRIVTLVLLTLWRAYWSYTKIKADKEKPKTTHKPIYWELGIIITVGIIILVSLLGLKILPLRNTLLQIIGFILVISGFVECIWARTILSTNWAESYDYQIKKDHELVTNGIYRFIRHPIYSGMIFMAMGSLLVAQTWLFLPIGILAFIGVDKLARREEKLLLKHFGKQYQNYMRVTKRLILWIY